MRIVIDLQGAQGSNRQRGIGKYSQALAYHICKHKGQHDIHIVLNYAFQDSIEMIKYAFQDVLPKENFHILDVISPTNNLSPENDNNRQLNEAMREAFIGELNPDFVLITSLFEGLVDDVVSSVNNYTHLPTAVVLYDLIPYIHRSPYLENPVVANWYLKKIDNLKRADLLLSISASSGQEAIDWLGFDKTQVTNISTACDAQFVPLTLTKQDYSHFEKTFNLTKPFMMYTGGIDYRKNIEGLIRSFAALPANIRNQHQLAVVCSVQDAERTRLTNLAKEYGLGDDDFIMTGFVSEEDLVKLYNACKLFIFPSWHEGFGLPALEAMKCGAPVIASNNSSLPEVIGLDEALFDPRDDESITAKLKQGLTDEKFRERLIKHGIEQAKKFNWEDIAKTAIQAIEQKHTQKLSQKIDFITPKMPRPRLAYLSPLPPEQSGISDYSAELLEELTRWYDIDVIVSQDTVSTPWIIANIKVRTVDWFIENSNNFDRVLYHFGNSPFHSHMFDLLPIIPGIVVLHDFYLSGIQAYRDAMQLSPHVWRQSLYHSHGYQAVKLLENESYPYEATWTYPANLKVIQDALGIIIHSPVSKQMAEDWYGKGITEDWHLIPLLKNTPKSFNRKDARDKLGFNEDSFIVCSFGMIGENKCSYELIQAFINSQISDNSNNYLILVGQLNPSAYEQKIKKLISTSGLSNQIKITGWADAQEYHLYLQTADVGVQLRTLSRGETSAAILDCMSYGIPTIVNANGSMAYIDDASVVMLDDKFELEMLTKALDELYASSTIRETLSKNSVNTIESKHNPKNCAYAYYNAIESTYAKHNNGLFNLIKQQSGNDALNISDDKTIEKIALNFPTKPKKKQIFIDISELVQRDSKTGIQRVVRSILSELLSLHKLGYSVEPVYATTDKLGYYYARKFTANFLGLEKDWAINTPIEFNSGDIFLGLDLQHHVVKYQKDFIKRLKCHGVTISYVVYDLLPILQSQFFVSIGYELHTQWLKDISIADNLICISKAVADEVYDWLAVFGDTNALSPIKVNWFHLGADLAKSVPSKGLPENFNEVISKLENNPSFLSVGTIEPRKGYEQTLLAFEELWQEGVKANLVIVGKTGWKTEEFIKKISSHKQLNKQLFWLDSISDEYLEKIYAACDCLIAASYGEGFGLPLIEAAQHKLPVIARDIPVFREVAGEYADYFEDSKDSTVITEAIKQWLQSQNNAINNKTRGQMPWLTWEQSTEQLLEALLDKKPTYKKWSPNNILMFWGNDSRLQTQVGEFEGKNILTTNTQGFLIYGPRQPLASGDYKVTIEGKFKNLSKNDYVDIAYEKGEQVVIKKSLSQVLKPSDAIEFTFTLSEKIDDFELRLWVNATSKLTVNTITIEPIATPTHTDVNV